VPALKITLLSSDVTDQRQPNDLTKLRLRNRVREMRELEMEMELEEELLLLLLLIVVVALVLMSHVLALILYVTMCLTCLPAMFLMRL
jgi:hypothetical protein